MEFKKEFKKPQNKKNNTSAREERFLKNKKCVCGDFFDKYYLKKHMLTCKIAHISENPKYFVELDRIAFKEKSLIGEPEVSDKSGCVFEKNCCEQEKSSISSQVGNEFILPSTCISSASSVLGDLDLKYSSDFSNLELYLQPFSLEFDSSNLSNVPPRELGKKKSRIDFIAPISSRCDECEFIFRRNRRAYIKLHNPNQNLLCQNLLCRKHKKTSWEYQTSCFDCIPKRKEFVKRLWKCFECKKYCKFKNKSRHVQNCPLTKLRKENRNKFQEFKKDLRCLWHVRDYKDGEPGHVSYMSYMNKTYEKFIQGCKNVMELIYFWCPNLDKEMKEYAERKKFEQENPNRNESEMMIIESDVQYSFEKYGHACDFHNLYNKSKGNDYIFTSYELESMLFAAKEYLENFEYFERHKNILRPQDLHFAMKFTNEFIEEKKEKRRIMSEINK
jgi:hypothetical protein